MHVPIGGWLVSGDGWRVSGVTTVVTGGGLALRGGSVSAGDVVEGAVVAVVAGGNVNDEGVVSGGLVDVVGGGVVVSTGGVLDGGGLLRLGLVDGGAEAVELHKRRKHIQRNLSKTVSVHDVQTCALY